MSTSLKFNHIIKTDQSRCVIISDFLLFSMENLRNIRDILNEDTCYDKAGLVEFTRQFSTKIEFEEWLKVERNTNNLVESYHNKLKTVYLKSARKQRPDVQVL